MNLAVGYNNYERNLLQLCLACFMWGFHVPDFIPVWFSLLFDLKSLNTSQDILERIYIEDTDNGFAQTRIYLTATKESSSIKDLLHPL